jgi:hypothetical protein
VNALAVLRHPDATRHREAGGATLADYAWDGTGAPPAALWAVSVAIAKAFGIAEIPARGSGDPATALVESAHYALMTCGVTDAELLVLLQQNASDPAAVAAAYYAAAAAKCKDALTGPAPSSGYPWGWILGGTVLAGAGVATIYLLARRRRRARA